MVWIVAAALGIFVGGILIVASEARQQAEKILFNIALSLTAGESPRSAEAPLVGGD